jgi:hypothetical protein
MFIPLMFTFTLALPLLIAEGFLIRHPVFTYLLWVEGYEVERFAFTRVTL